MYDIPIVSFNHPKTFSRQNNLVASKSAYCIRFPIYRNCFIIVSRGTIQTARLLHFYDHQLVARSFTQKTVLLVIFLLKKNCINNLNMYMVYSSKSIRLNFLLITDNSYVIEWKLLRIQNYQKYIYLIILSFIFLYVQNNNFHDTGEKQIII